MYYSASVNYFDVMGAAKKTYSRVLETVCREWNLTRNELDVMLFLYNNPEYDRAADIVSRRGIAKSHVSLGVGALEEKGLLIRRFDANDRRTAHLILLEPGQKIAAQARGGQTRFFAALFQGLGQEELAFWDEITQRVCHNIENLDDILETMG